MDPLKIKPRRDWCLVLDDARADTVAGGLIALPNFDTKEERLTEGVGTITGVGDGARNEALKLESGMRVVYRSYLKYANTIETEEKWGNGSRKKYFLIDTNDLIGIVDPDTSVGVFSSPASHSVPAGAFDAPKKGKKK